MHDSKPLLIVMNASREYGNRIASHVAEEVIPHEERGFEDGEHKIRPLASVRNQNVFVIDSLHADAKLSVNDKLCRLLFLIGALHDASAGRVIAVVPYLCYARKDRKTKPRDPVTTRYVARMFEAVGTDHLLTMDVHNLAAFQNAFGSTTTDHLEAMHLFVDHFSALNSDDELAVISPDVGGVKRAELFRQALQHKTGRQITMGFLQKQRSEGIVTTGAFVGDVKDRTVIIIDDLISSGTTLCRAATACRANGAKTIYAAATHSMFSSNAESILSASAFDRIVVTDTVPPWRLSNEFIASKLDIVDTTPLFASAIQCINWGESIIQLQT
ncbi:Ribose-phosphate pyrophosphokinase [Planctomycetes bacterium CA13]|uniref:ribose-phosphate diphosphokinase n=1 Tax=Novipirellula herctigrandis TaxID=2527986 RepID=A0A5C5Z2P0_9BACT|nr:Ribose-phosphate pyrophosphokinase [Planctomycetes bacterium CA13]